MTATDPESNTLTYSLEGTDAAAFDIDSTSGQLRTSAALDYETRSSYSVTVVAEDSEGASDSIAVTIAVTNANEPPSFDPDDNTRSVRRRSTSTRLNGQLHHEANGQRTTPRSTTRRGRATR